MSFRFLTFSGQSVRLCRSCCFACLFILLLNAAVFVLSSAACDLIYLQGEGLGFLFRG